MKTFGIIEIGSTNTKAYLYKDDKVIDLGFKTIEFKNHYKLNNRLDENDKKELYGFIKTVDCEDIYVYGTSIFRNLSDNERDEWLKEFKDNTGLDFTIVSSDMENELTVYGATANIDFDGTIGVMIGGGGSTELSIVKDKKIIEKANSTFGAMDTTDMFPDLRTDKVTSNFDEMIRETKKLVNVPKNKADILILAGGDYIYFYEGAGFPIEKNKYYDNELQPYSIDIKTMDKWDQEFFYNMSLEEVIKKNGKDGWWRGTRGMRLCVKALADILEVTDIIPTRISMVYGIVEKIKNGLM